MTDSTTDFGAIEAQTSETTADATLAEFGAVEEANRPETDSQIAAETATEFGIDDRDTADPAESGAQAELSNDDTDTGQLDLTGETVEIGPKWSDMRDNNDETRYLGDVYGPTMERPIPEVERCRYDHWETPIDIRETIGTPVCPRDLAAWTVELETGIHTDDIESPGGNRFTDQEHWTATGESRQTPELRTETDETEADR